MKKFLREVLLSVVIGLAVPSVWAQSESFTGMSGKDYCVDYDAGLVMRLQNDEATLLSPVAVVETEFKPMLERVQIMAEECEIAFTQLQYCKMAISDIASLLDQMQYASYAEQLQNALNAQPSLGNKEMPDICKSIADNISARNAFSFGIESMNYSIVETELSIMRIMENINYLQMSIDELAYYISSGLAPVDVLAQQIDYCAMSVMNAENYAYNVNVDVMILGEKCNDLNENFTTVLFFGYNGEIGMWPSIMENDGEYKLPDVESFGGTEYHVTAVDGNIFSCVPGVSLPPLHLVLPSEVKSIQNGAFAINDISSVTVPTNEVPSIEDNCFTADVYQNAILFVPSDMVDAFKANPVWSKFSSLSTSGLSGNMMSDSSIRIEGSTIVVDGYDVVSVYTMDGHTVYTGRNKTIELPSKGLYIVKAGDKTVKIRY